MTDDRLDKLGTYFVYFDVLKRYGITFERFIQIVDRGRWSDYV